MMGNIFFLQGIVVLPFGTNFPLWSLAYEFWFYVAFPFLLFLLLPETSALKRLGCAVALLSIFLLVGSNIALYFCFWTLGAVVELAPKRLSERTASYLAPVAGVAFIAVLGGLLKSKLPILESDTIESVAFACLCYIVVHLQKKSRNGWIGTATSSLAAVSYTLYLVHAPILIFLCNLLMPVWHPWTFNVGGLVKYGAVVSAIFLLAVLLYWMFERRTPLVRAWMTRTYERLSGMGAVELIENRPDDAIAQP